MATLTQTLRPGIDRRPQDGMWPVRLWDLVLLAITIVALAILTIVGIGLWAAIFGYTLVEGLALNVANVWVFCTCGLVAVRWIILQRRGVSWGDLGFRAIGRTELLRCLLAGYGILLLSGLVSAAATLLLGVPQTDTQQEFIAPASQGFTWAGLIIMLIAMGVLVPFTEEILFRGVLYGALRTHWGVPAATVGSAAVFGLLHFEPILVVATFVMGVFFARAYQHSGSLWSSIAMHSALNCAAIWLMYMPLH